jgi:hypothetical protein
MGEGRLRQERYGSGEDQREGTGTLHYGNLL